MWTAVVLDNKCYTGIKGHFPATFHRSDIKTLSGCLYAFIIMICIASFDNIIVIDAPPWMMGLHHWYLQVNRYKDVGKASILQRNSTWISDTAIRRSVCRVDRYCCCCCGCCYDNNNWNTVDVLPFCQASSARWRVSCASLNVSCPSLRIFINVIWSRQYLPTSTGVSVNGSRAEGHPWWHEVTIVMTPTALLMSPSVHLLVCYLVIGK